jgi:hypothetical protein
MCLVSVSRCTQLWDAVSGLLTPVSIQYVRKVAAGEDVATALGRWDWLPSLYKENGRHTYGS